MPAKVNYVSRDSSWITGGVAIVFILAFIFAVGHIIYYMGGCRRYWSLEMRLSSCVHDFPALRSIEVFRWPVTFIRLRMMFMDPGIGAIASGYTLYYSGVTVAGFIVAVALGVAYGVFIVLFMQFLNSDVAEAGDKDAQKEYEQLMKDSAEKRVQDSMFTCGPCWPSHESSVLPRTWLVLPCSQPGPGQTLQMGCCSAQVIRVIGS